MLGEDLRARLLDARYTALLIDGDPEDTTVLELRLLEAGIDVKVARSSVEAIKLLEKADIDIVLSELDLPAGDGTDGLALLADVRSKPWGKTLPWMVYTRRTSHADAQRAFELGVLDFASKLSQESLLVAKVRALLDGRGAQRSSRGVTGSIREMSLPDIVQVLTSGRKSGSLRIRAGAETGEIHLADGDVVDSAWGKIRGEEAFYAMLKLSDGDFALDPAFVPTGRVIEMSSEMLLLEGMRRLDEG
jgi:CheY-like chemotaxis protein